MTELYFRNPYNYIREVVEVPAARNIIWDYGILVKRNIDPYRHAKLNFGENAEFNILVCGEQGVMHLDQDHPPSDPKAVYPAFVYGEDTLEDLEDMVNNPPGLDWAACDDQNTHLSERPVYGQDHMIVITKLPPAGGMASRNFLRQLRDIQGDYEGDMQLTFHVHGSYSYTMMFAQGFDSADCDPRTDASKGNVILPNGKNVTFEKARTMPHWVTMLDVPLSDLKLPAVRCIYNIKSALFAAEHFSTDLKFRTSGKPAPVDPKALAMANERGVRTVLGGRKPQEGDMVNCNSCSLQDSCKSFRTDSVCTINDSTSAMARMFKSRNASNIIDALGTLVGSQAERLEKAIEDEELEEGLNPEINKMYNALFKNGVALAKLVDPSLSKPSLQVNIGQGATVQQAPNPQQMVANAVAALEAQGFRREDITMDMIKNMIEGGGQEALPASQQTIQGSVQ